MTLLHLAVDERTEFLGLLESLAEEQWDASTLSGRWSVREVVAHVLSFEDLEWPAVVRLFFRGGVRFGRVNDLALMPFAEATNDQLIERMRTHLVPRGLTAGFKGGIALTDGMIHQQDIRRPLGISRSIPGERVRAALGIAVKAPTLPSRRRTRGLRLVASDIDWSVGNGPEIVGPSEALLMLIAGRENGAADCKGPGIRVWQERQDS